MKTDNINIRTSENVKAIIQQAADSVDKTVTDFMLDSGLSAAYKALADRQVFALDDEQWQLFQDALDQPPQDKPELEKLLTKPGFFD